jgi:hypothetical protein
MLLNWDRLIKVQHEVSMENKEGSKVASWFNKITR